MPDEIETTSGWFRHRRSGQVFEAEGYQYREALKNRDLEAMDEPGETSDDTPSAKMVALRERVSGLGLEWTASDTLETLNRKLDDHTVTLRGQADQLKIKYMPNWKPETLASKIAEATAQRVQVQSPANNQQSTDTP